MKKAVAIGLSALASIFLMAAPAFASPSSGITTSNGIVSRTQHFTAAALPAVTMTAVDAKGAVHTLADPPGGGCDYSKLIGVVQGNYQGGTLVGMIAGYNGQIVCTTTAADQYMARLDQHASLWHNSDQVSDAHQGICTNCNQATSVGYYSCNGQACGGWYYVRLIAEMQLPAGWTWTGTTPSNCESPAADVRRCTVYSSYAYV
jgi:hypothetical protein